MINKLSSLDIRIAVLAYPLVAKEGTDILPFGRKMTIPLEPQERVVSLFQNSPKAAIEPTPSKLPPLVRKGQFLLLRMQTMLKIIFLSKEKSTVLSNLLPPRKLLVPQLPHPPFQSHRPPRFFWHPAYEPPEDAYTPSCLMSDTKESPPTTVYHSSDICAYAKRAFPLEGILRKDKDGFVYLELTDAFILDLFPLINDHTSEMVPLHLVEPSPAHIPVILPHEWAQCKGWGEIEELGMSIFFEIKNLCSLCPKRWPGVEKVYFLTIQCLTLEELRAHHLLPSRIRGHDFHVAIAVQRTTAPHARSDPKETFRLNVSCFAA